MKADMFYKTFKICQKFNKRNTLYVHMLPMNVSELKHWDLVHINLRGPYSNSIRQQHPSGAIIWKNSSLDCMTMINPATGWFNIVKIPTFDLDEVTEGNDE